MLAWRNRLIELADRLHDLYLAKELHPTAVLYGIFLLLAITGLLDWKRVLKRQVASA